MSVVAEVFDGQIVVDKSLDGPASYDCSGQRFVYRGCGGSESFAIDVESRLTIENSPVDCALGIDSRRQWTEIEVIAKLFDQPAHLVFQQFCRLGRQKSLRLYPIEISRCDTETHFIAVARRRSTGMS